METVEHVSAVFNIEVQNCFALSVANLSVIHTTTISPGAFCVWHYAAVSYPKIDKRRVVSEEEGKRWAAEHGFKYFETSAKSGASVSAVFMKLFETALARMKET